MFSHRIAIIYGTRYGQTMKIAERMQEVLTAAGHAVPIACADTVLQDFSLSSFDGVIIGGSVIAGRHQRYLERFVRAHRDELNRMPSAFLSVSASAAGSTERDHANARRVLDEFLTKTGWHPRTVAAIAGAMAFTKYGVFTRMILKMISRRASGPTDTSRDHEMTDWNQVAQFATEFAASLPEPKAYRASNPEIPDWWTVNARQRTEVGAPRLPAHDVRMTREWEIDMKSDAQLGADVTAELRWTFGERAPWIGVNVQDGVRPEQRFMLETVRSKTRK